MIKAQAAASLTNIYTNKWDINNIIDCNARLGKFMVAIPDYKIPEEVDAYQLVYSLNKAGYSARFVYDNKDCDEYYIIVSWYDAMMEEIGNA